jgi:Na+/melibiose symporter-like transporter
VTRRLRARYGASPLHAAGHVAAIVFIAWLLWLVLPGGGRARAVNLGLWLVAGAVLHDLVFLPAYAVADRIARAATSRRPATVNYIRVPAVISGVLLLVYFPLILTRAESTYERATGRPVTGYATAWAAITAGLFAASALAYAVRRRRSRVDDLKYARVAPGDVQPPADAVDRNRVGLTDRREAP